MLCLTPSKALALNKKSSIVKSGYPIGGLTNVSRTRGVSQPALLTSSEAVTNSVTHLVHQNSQLLATIADDPAPASTDNGPVALLANFLEQCLTVLNGQLENAGVPYAYGFAIILLTIGVKLATFPLSQKQVQSSVAVQALAPRIKEIQVRYANEPEQLQMETAKLYRDAGVNPLAGCLPTLATIPVFIGLYKALTQAADDGLLSQGFFWIPSLAGPVSVATRDSGSGLSWLFPFQDGAPAVGWHDAICYLVLPVLLVASQYVSQAIISPPKSDDPAQQQTQNILKFLPLMIGWFSLNVPSGLCLYWFVNNILSTAQQVYLKSTTVVNIPAMAPSADAVQMPIVKPKEEKARKLTGKDFGARRKPKDGGDYVDVEAVEITTPSSGTNGSSKPDAGGQGEKFRARKAREAAAKAASVAVMNDKGNNAKQGSSSDSN